MMKNVGKESIKSRKTKNIWETVRSEYESLSLVKMPWIHARKKASYHSQCFTTIQQNVWKFGEIWVGQAILQTFQLRQAVPRKNVPTWKMCLGKCQFVYWLPLVRMNAQVGDSNWSIAYHALGCGIIEVSFLYTFFESAFNLEILTVLFFNLLLGLMEETPIDLCWSKDHGIWV